MRKFFTTLSLFLLVLSFALGQGNFKIVEFGAKSEEPITLSQDEILVFQLPSTPSTGYSWQVVDVNNAILELDKEFHFNPQGEGMLITEGIREIRFAGKSSGTTKVSLRYSRPWENTKEDLSYTYTIYSDGEYNGEVDFIEPELEVSKITAEDYEVKALPSQYEYPGTSSIKNQGSCGSCWAFAACAVFEHVIKGEDGVTRDLSEQFLVSCNSEGWGCSGGLNPYDYFEYKVVYGDNDYGAVYEYDAPYQGTDGYCNAPYPHHEKIEDWGYVGSGYGSLPSVSQIKQAIYNYGPMWCAVYVDSYFQSYNSGVFQGSGSSQPNHAVVITGWDDYNQCWIMKNSWGSSWGESGYMRIKYGANNIGYGSAYMVYNGSGGDDTQAPTAPSNLNASNITSTTVDLSWTASTDNVGVTEYQVLQNGSALGTVTGTSATVNNLSPATTYTYTVKALDAAGNISAASNAINVTTTDDSQGSYCESQGNNSNYEWISEVTIGTFTNSSGASGYTDFTYKNIELTSGSNVSISLTPGFNSSTYNEYWKIWIDYNRDYNFSSDELVFDPGSMSKTTVNGTISIPSNVSGSTRMRISMKYNAAPSACETFTYGEVEDYTVTFVENGEDTQPPTAPTNLTASNITTTTVDLSWSASSDNVGVEEYQVLQGGSVLGAVSGTSATVSSLTPATTYTFSVKAVDAAGNISQASNSINVTTVDDSPVEYCSSKGNNTNYEWIDLVELNGINNSTGANGGYADFTNLSANVTPGSSQRIYISCGFSGSSYTEYWQVWIDWDQSGTFDSDELIVSGSSSSADRLYADFNVPSNALLGTTRMRVTMKYNAAATACETFSYGEVEDYSINVTTASTYFTSVNNEADILGNEEPTQLRIYPVPAKDYITVSISNGREESTINIYNALGALIKVVELKESTTEIDISDLPAGAYYISVTDAKEPINKSFVKQ